MSRPIGFARVLALAALLLFAAGGAQADTIRCESKNGAYTTCQANTSGGVSLSRQLSSQGCWQNDTWGYSRNQIWVNRGCRAEFWTGSGSSNTSSNNKAAAAVAIALVGAAVIASKNRNDNDNYNNNYDPYDSRYRPRYSNDGEPGSVFRCESKSNRLTYCNLPYRGHVEIYRQQSSSPCTYGQSWGAERGRIWVNNGCRADFAVY